MAHPGPPIASGRGAAAAAAAFLLCAHLWGCTPITLDRPKTARPSPEAVDIITGPWEGVAVQTMAIDPSAPSTLYVAGIFSGSLRLFKSVDSGTTWRRLERGLPEDRDSIQLLVIDPRTPTTLYAGTSVSGVFKSVDAGESWQQGGVPADRGGIWPTALVIDPRTPTTLYTAGAGGVFKSLDGGMSWRTAARGLPGVIRHLVIDPLTPATLYAGSREGAWKTTNGGASWVRSSTGLPNPKGYGASEPPEPWVEALAIAPGTPGTVYAGTRSGLYRSADGGASWTLASDSWRDTVVSFVAVDPAIPATVYAGGVGRPLSRSADGGATWNPVGSRDTISGSSALAIAPRTPNTLYLGGFGPRWGLRRIRAQ